MGRRGVVTLLALMLAAPAAWAPTQSSPVEVRSSGALVSSACTFLDWLASDATVQRIGSGCRPALASTVSKLGTCIGDDAAEHCGIDSYAGISVDMRTADELLAPRSTSLPTGKGPNGSLCDPPDTRYVTETGTAAAEVCACVYKPCGVAGVNTTECGTAGNCTSNRCTSGSTSTEWICRPLVEPMFGTGADGVFYFPTPTGGSDTSCTAADCPTQCSTCTGSTRLSTGCTCTFALNSHRGNFGLSPDGTGAPTFTSVIKNFTFLYVGPKNTLAVADRVGANYVGNGCNIATNAIWTVGTDLWIRVQHDATFEGSAKVTMVGKGMCGGSAGGTLANLGGNAGCGTAFPGPLGGVGSSAGGASLPIAWEWLVGDRTPCLFGAGGSKPTVSGGNSCANLPANVNGYKGQMCAVFGGSSGGGGGCAASPSGTAGTPGHGGGGFILDVGGTFKTLANASLSPAFDTSGSTGSGSTHGAAGGGSQLYRYRAISDTTSPATAYTTAAGAAGSSATNCGAGGAAAAGAVVKMAIP